MGQTVLGFIHKQDNWDTFDTWITGVSENDSTENTPWRILLTANLFMRLYATFIKPKTNLYPNDERSTLLQLGQEPIADLKYFRTILQRYQACHTGEVVG